MEPISLECSFASPEMVPTRSAARMPPLRPKPMKMRAASLESGRGSALAVDLKPGMFRSLSGEWQRRNLLFVGLIAAAG